MTRRPGAPSLITRRKTKNGRKSPQTRKKAGRQGERERPNHNKLKALLEPTTRTGPKVAHLGRTPETKDKGTKGGRKREGGRAKGTGAMSDRRRKEPADSRCRSPESSDVFLFLLSPSSLSNLSLRPTSESFLQKAKSFLRSRSQDVTWDLVLRKKRTGSAGSFVFLLNLLLTGSAPVLELLPSI